MNLEYSKENTCDFYVAWETCQVMPGHTRPSDLNIVGRFNRCSCASNALPTLCLRSEDISGFSVEAFLNDGQLQDTSNVDSFGEIDV